MSNEIVFDAGYDAGKEVGLAEGHAMGYAVGHATGMIEAMELSLAAPDNEYFAAGYRAGVADTKRLPQATFQEGWDEGFERGYQARASESDGE